MTKSFLSIQSLSHDFSNGHGPLPVLQDISFDVGEGEFVCLLGPSGSGKSTLLRVLAGLLAPSKGSVCLHGQLVRGPREGVGMVFQQANLMPWRTVLENISLPLEVQGRDGEAARQHAAELLQLVGLDGFEAALPGELSGGMAQRVAIARALVQDPELLLLDEPFGALDAITREQMGEELLRIWQARRKTVVMVTHDISEAIFLSDRVLVFSERPGQLTLDMDVTLPRPRLDEMRYTREFGKMARELRKAIGNTVPRK